MKIKKKPVIIVSAIVLSLVLTAGAVFAVGAHRFCNGNFSERVLSHIDSRVQELELRPEQQTKYQALRQSLEANLKQGAAKRKAFFLELQTIVKQDRPDIKAATALARKMLGEMSGLMSANLDLFTEFYGILDKDQQDRFLSKVRQKFDRIQARCAEAK